MGHVLRKLNCGMTTSVYQRNYNIQFLFRGQMSLEFILLCFRRAFILNIVSTYNFHLQCLLLNPRGKWKQGKLPTFGMLITSTYED